MLKPTLEAIYPILESVWISGKHDWLRHSRNKIELIAHLMNILHYFFNQLSLAP